MRTRTLVIAALLAALGACDDSDGPTGGGAGGTGGGSSGSNMDGSGGGSTSAKAPKILTLSTNVKTLHENGALVVSAVVTDPDGIGDVIGGQLVTPDGGTAYGAFATDASEGAYSLSLSWTAINQTESIDTAVGSAAPRVFRASFFDAEGNSAYRDVTVDLQCSDASKAACDGVCGAGTDVYTTAQCGSCGHSCPAISGAAVECLDQSGGVCVMAKTVQQRVACNTQCTNAPYSRCLGGEAYYGSMYVQVSCSMIPAATNGTDAFTDMDCYCSDN